MECRDLVSVSILVSRLIFDLGLEADQHLGLKIWGENTFLGGKVLFSLCLKQNFLYTTKFGGHCPRITPGLWACLEVCKSRFKPIVFCLETLNTPTILLSGTSAIQSVFCLMYLELRKTKTAGKNARNSKKFRLGSGDENYKNQKKCWLNQAI